MKPTRRSVAVGVLAVSLAGLAVLFARPALLAGATLVGAWLLAAQYQFVRNVSRATDSISVQQSPAESGPRPGETTPVTLDVTLPEPASLTIDVAAGVPTATTTTDELVVRLQRGESGAVRTVPATWPVTGRHRFNEATVRITDGLFEETISAGQTPTVTVEPNGPRRLFVGEGGDRTVRAYGEHTVDRTGSGIEPAEIREYVPGDRADRIDWKATARLATPHVREYESETHRRTLLVVDHRSSLARGPPDETKLDYLREVAVSMVTSANRLDDPVGLLTVGDSGVTASLGLGSTSEQYAAIRRRLLDLEPTVGDDSARRGRSVPDPASAGHRRQPTGADIRQTLSALEEDEDEFSAALYPFYADRRTYQQRIETDPLTGAVRGELSRQPNRPWTVIFTDDTKLAELQETVTVARTNGTEVLVVIAPTVLYEPGSFGTVEQAYDRYLTFERRRRRLARMDGVTALEVGPDDRLSTVLPAERTRGGTA